MRNKGINSAEGVRYSPSAMKNYRKKSVSRQANSLQNDLGMSTNVTGTSLTPDRDQALHLPLHLNSLTALQSSQTSGLAITPTADMHLREGLDSSPLVPTPERKLHAPPKQKRGRGRHRLDKRYSGDGWRRADTLFESGCGSCMSTDVSRQEWSSGELDKLSFRQLNDLDGTPGLANLDGTGDSSYRLTYDTVVPATERHPIPLGDEGQEDLVCKQPSFQVMEDGWPRNVANGQTIPRVIDIGARDSADRAERIYGRDAIGFPTTRRVAEGYRREVCTESPELITAWVNTLPKDFLGDCLETQEQKDEAARLLYTFRDLSDMPPTDLVKHEIPTKPYARPKTADMPLYTEEEKQFMSKMLLQLMKAGVLAHTRTCRYND